MAYLGYGYNENCIEWIKDEGRATLSLSQRRTINRVEQLAKNHPDECQITARNTDGSRCAQVPVSWIKISPPKQLSEEQRSAMALRFHGNNLNTPTIGNESE